VDRDEASGVKGFGDTARVLARNALGIIALFIVLVYGFACLVTAFSSSFTPVQKTPLVYFLVIFPVLVLGVFSWLVSCHSGKLFAPSDFRDEENYVRMQLSAVASLAVASTKGETSGSESDIQKIVEVVQDVRFVNAASPTHGHRKILWVDDRPQNNIHERQAFEAMGLSFTLALSTGEALGTLSREKYAAIISDMGRKEGPREGYALLDALRQMGDKTPFFIYAASNTPEHKRETVEHGGQGCTNNAKELFHMVTSAVLSRHS